MCENHDRSRHPPKLASGARPREAQTDLGALEPGVALVQPSFPSSSARSELRALFDLALPLALAGLGQMLLDAVSIAVAGRNSPSVLGAVGLGSSVFFTLGVFGVGVVLGVEPLVARAVGRGDTRLARRCLAQGLWVSALLGGALGVAVVCVGFFLHVVGIDKAWQVVAYLALRAPSLGAYLAVVALRSFLGARGRARVVLAAAVIANLVNLAVAPVLILGHGSFEGWGAGGAGLAATLATLVQLAVMASASRLAFARPDRKILVRALALGIPIGLQMVAEFGVFALIGVAVAAVGTESLAAHQVAMTLAGATFTVSVGIAGAGALRVASALGQGNFAAARRAKNLALSLGVGFMLSASLAFLLCPRILARVVCPDPGVIEAAVPLFAAAAAFQLFDGMQVVAAGALRAAGDTRSALFANLVGHYLVGLPLGLTLAFVAGAGVVGLWWGLCAGLGLVALFLGVKVSRSPAFHGARPEDPMRYPARHDGSRAVALGAFGRPAVGVLE